VRRLPRLFFDLLHVTQPRGNEMAKIPFQRHVVERISPRAELFIGKCLACGAENLQLHQTAEECPNPNNLNIGEIVSDFLKKRIEKGKG
jgi:hypothetical protein